MTPRTVACQAPLSTGFSRQEYGSGLPCSPSGDLPKPGIKPRSPTLWEDSLATEPQGKPNNTGVGSLYLFHQIFPTQESHQGILHFRWIIYKLSYQGKTLFSCFLSSRKLSSPLSSPLTLLDSSFMSLECGPLEKGMANHFSILALRTL